MPYIEQDRRNRLWDTLEALDYELENLGDVGGDLNFVIFRLMYWQFMRNRKYSTLERLRGSLENCISEFYRRVVGPYEDEAKVKNGDIF